MGKSGVGPAQWRAGSSAQQRTCSGLVPHTDAGPLVARADAALFPPARPNGLGAAFRAGVTPPRLAAATVTCVLAACALGGVAGPLALVAACLATWLLGRAITAMIPGLTGDTYGAIAEVTEVVTLFLLALLGGNRTLLAITP